MHMVVLQVCKKKKKQQPGGKWEVFSGGLPSHKISWKKRLWHVLASWNDACKLPWWEARPVCNEGVRKRAAKYTGSRQTPLISATTLQSLRPKSQQAPRRPRWLRKRNPGNVKWAMIKMYDPFWWRWQSKIVTRSVLIYRS